ncbi:FAD/NAD-binding domain-containing protein [Moniliophthora roreri]|nr:FAD/NAD-binding domain-containing protein [Moniliophthora roreri]
MFSEQSRTSALQLKFVVVGASTSGLSVAYLLRRSGHDVVVVERHSHVPQASVDGGLRIPPNMARLLQDFPGMKELMTEKATVVSFCSGETMKLLGQMVFSEQVMTDLGSNFYLMSYSDMVSHLYKLCQDIGVTMKHNFSVKEVISSPDSVPAVISASGTRLTGDIIIGADGRNSVVRRLMFPEEPESEDDDLVIPGSRSSTPAAQAHEIVSVSLTVPTRLMERDPELQSLTKNDRFMLWTGNGHATSGSPCGPDRYNFGLTYSNYIQPDSDVIGADWYDSKPISTMEGSLSSYHPVLQKLVKLAPVCYWNSQTSPCLSKYSNEFNQVALIGDAAHCVPFEDAVTFGRIFSRIKSRADVPSLLNGFNEIKRRRTRQTENTEHSAVAVIGIPPGPHRDARDTALAKTLELEGADDETLANAWSEYLQAFNYDANDAVEEWRRTWAMTMRHTYDQL